MHSVHTSHLVANPQWNTYTNPPKPRHSFAAKTRRPNRQPVTHTFFPRRVVQVALTRAYTLVANGHTRSARALTSTVTCRSTRQARRKEVPSVENESWDSTLARFVTRVTLRKASQPFPSAGTVYGLQNSNYKRDNREGGRGADKLSRGAKTRPHPARRNYSFTAARYILRHRETIKMAYRWTKCVQRSRRPPIQRNFMCT